MLTSLLPCPILERDAITVASADSRSGHAKGSLSHWGGGGGGRAGGGGEILSARGGLGAGQGRRRRGSMGGGGGEF